MLDLMLNFFSLVRQGRKSLASFGQYAFPDAFSKNFINLKYPETRKGGNSGFAESGFAEVLQFLLKIKPIELKKLK